MKYDNFRLFWRFFFEKKTTKKTLILTKSRARKFVQFQKENNVMFILVSQIYV